MRRKNINCFSVGITFAIAIASATCSLAQSGTSAGRPVQIGGSSAGIDALIPNLDDLPDASDGGDDDLLLAPAKPSTSRSGSDDAALERQRREIEERTLRTERLRAEARARFESRSREELPKLQPRQAEDVTSPSDRPQRLGSDGFTPTEPTPRVTSGEQSNPFVKPRPSAPVKTPKAELEDMPKTEAAIDPPAPPRPKVMRSVLDQPQPMGTPLWAQMENPHPLTATSDYRPAGFSIPSGTITATCGACGGCVDRRGTECCDQWGHCLGIGPIERKECNCWRCPQGRPFNQYGPGSYVGPARPAPLSEYRLRAGDQVQLTFLVKTLRSEGAYRLVVGDELLIESEADEKLTRGTLEKGLEIQPDGTITLRFIGQVHAAGQTIVQLRSILNDRYEEYYPEPAIDVTPVRTGTIARQVREAISGIGGFNPQQSTQTVTPEGVLRLPKLGAVPAQGLTLAELKREINLRYDSISAGLELEPNLEVQAPHYVYVLGEVLTPGRLQIDAPTTVIGSLAMAGSYNPGANLRQIVIFRRGPNWELLATSLDLRAALLGRQSNPADEIWLQDGDIVIVPPSPIRLFDRFVSQVFTEGVYGIVPFGGFSFTYGNDN